MEFRKMVMTTLYVRQQKRHTDIKNRLLDSVGEGESVMREQNWNMYIIICEIDDQSKFNAWNRAPKAGALGQLRGMGWEGMWKGGSGWGDTCIPVANSCQCMAKTTTIL